MISASEARTLAKEHISIQNRLYEIDNMVKSASIKGHDRIENISLSSGVYYGLVLLGYKVFLTSSNGSNYTIDWK